MAGRSSVIKISVLGDASDLQKAFSETETGAGKWAGKMESAGKRLTLGLTAPIVAGAGLAIKAGAEEAQQMEVLAEVIRKRIPDATDEMIAKNEEWIGSLQNTIGVADGELRDMQQKFISAGASMEEAQKLTALAYDTAAATGKEATSVGDAFVKGINGQVSGLSRLGIKTTDAAGKTRSFEEIQEELARTMGGTAAAAVDTAAGRAELLKLSMGDLQEEIGMKLLPILEKLVEWVGSVVSWFRNLDPEAQNVAMVIAGIAAAIGPVLIIGAKLVKSFQVVMGAFKALTALVAANPWVLLIAATVALVVLIVKNWDKIKRFLSDTWEAIKRTAKTVWDWIKTTISGVAEWLVNLFLNWTIVGRIIKHWDAIKESIRTLITFIKEKWNGVIDWFRNLPDRVGRAVSGMWDGIKDAFRGAINWIITKWNNFKITLGGQKVNLPFGASFDIPEITLNTPNIPKLHSGGMFRSPPGSSEGLALLKDREMVLPPGRRAGSSNVYEIRVVSIDPRQAGRIVVEALQAYERGNGAIPISVRSS